MAVQSVRLALLGAGIFATDDYLPALAALENTFDVVAVYSRTQESAAALVGRLDRPADIYTDLVAVLAREDVEAVAIVLPIFLLPAIVEMALAAVTGDAREVHPQEGFVVNDRQLVVGVKLMDHREVITGG